MRQSRNNKNMKPLNIVGLTIVLGGILLLVAFGLYKFLEDVQIPPIIKWGTVAIILGIIIILISLIKERLKEKN